MIFILNLIFIIMFGLYFILIFIITIGWYKISVWGKYSLVLSTELSIVIAFRNEANQLPMLLDCLNKQIYPKNLFEVIFVDDHSSDNGYNIIETFIKTNRIDNFKIVNNDNGTNKKSALAYGFRLSKGNLIVTTDADCVMGENWLFTIASYYEKHHPKLISGPVAFKYNNVFEKIQALEFSSLIASGAGAIEIKAPIMCNGANLAFEKDLFCFDSDTHNAKNFISGDDVFLLMHAKIKYGNHLIHFVKSKDAIVYTKACESIKSFFYQRIRWVSKSSGYTDFSMIAVSLIVFIANFLLLSVGICSIFYKTLLIYFVIAFVLKLIVDFPIIYDINKFFNQKKLLWYYLVLQIIYSLYVVFFGLAGQFLPFVWKNRKFKK